jgi:hypothetical protein
MGVAGFAACLLTLMVVTGAAVTGRDALGFFSRLLWNTRISWVIGALLAASWIFKIVVTVMN